MKIIQVIICLLLIFAIFSIGCYIEEPEDNNNSSTPKNSYSSEEDEEFNETPCESFANKIDECTILFCKSITYECELCNCMLNNGKKCKYSYHNNMKTCTNESENIAEKYIDVTNCNDVESNLLAICPPRGNIITYCSGSTDKCKTGTYGGRCVGYINSTGNTYYDCSKFCYLVGDSVECNEGEACYPAYYEHLCFPAGNINTGWECTYTNDCAPGNACLGTDDSDYAYCYRICLNNLDCPSKQSCIDTGFGYSVCVK